MNKIILAIAAALLLTACGGGGGGGEASPAANAAVEGVYGGFFTEQGGGTFELIAAVAPDGEAIAYSQDGGRFYSANLGASGNTLGGTFRAFDVVSGSSFSIGAQAATTGTVAGQVFSRSSINGGFSNNQGQVGTISLGYDVADSERAADLSFLNGTWGNTDSTDGFTLTVTINNGQLSGSDSNGCNYSANITVIRSTLNVYRLSNGVASCPGQPTFGSSGLLVRAVEPTFEGIILGASNSTTAIAAALFKL